MTDMQDATAFVVIATAAVGGRAGRGRQNPHGDLATSMSGEEAIAEVKRLMEEEHHEPVVDALLQGTTKMPRATHRPAMRSQRSSPSSRQLHEGSLSTRWRTHHPTGSSELTSSRDQGVVRDDGGAVR